MRPEVFAFSSNAAHASQTVGHLNNARLKTDLPKDVKQCLNTKFGTKNTVEFLKEIKLYKFI